MNLYTEAVAAIRTQRETLAATLKLAADQARQANVAATREALRNLVPIDDPLRPVAELLADRLTIGRDDGYPGRTLPSEARLAWEAAIRALDITGCPRTEEAQARGGLLAVYRNANGIYWVDLESVATAEHYADYTAWSRYKDFMAAQTVNL
jgi:hypothetical protein